MRGVTFIAAVVTSVLAAAFAVEPAPASNHVCTWVPDRSGAIFDFTQACQRHDDCYDTPGRSQKECDEEFRTNMLGWCEKAHRKAKARRLSCRATAQSYYRGVRTGGAYNYGKAQFAAQFAGTYEGNLTITSYTTDADITGLEDTTGPLSFTVTAAGAVRGDVAGSLNMAGSGPISITDPIGWGGRVTGSLVLRWSSSGVSATATVSGTLNGVIFDGSNTPFSMTARLQLEASKVSA